MSDDRFRRISDDITAGRQPEEVTVRELLKWFGVQRRGLWIVDDIRHSLDKHNLITEPDFQGEYIDKVISFIRPSDAERKSDDIDKTVTLQDPTYRIGRLESANKEPISVAPDHTLEKAVTLMLTNDYSQLPVMTNNRIVKGMISWSSIGIKLALSKNLPLVRDYMETHREISSDTSLFAAIDRIVEYQYVLIRDREQKISGIVTTSDLSVQFKQLGEPFLLIGEIENYIRRMIQGKFSKDDLAKARDPADEREIDGPSDLTFGGYCRLLENEDRWNKLDLAIDRVEFANNLNIVRRIRNDVMHFDPDGIPGEDIRTLYDFVEFLQRLAYIHVI